MNLAKIDRAPSTETAKLVANKGYHSRAVLKDLDGSVWKTRIAEPQHTAFLRWHGDTEARGRCETRRFTSPSASGRENVHKRYLIHVAGHNLGILMRLLIGAGTSKEAAPRARVLLFVVHGEEILACSSSLSRTPTAVATSASSSPPSPPTPT